MPDGPKFLVQPTGSPLLHGEPVFILRGKDLAAVEAIQAYRDECRLIGAGPDHLKAIEEIITAFAEYRIDNPDDMKVPD